MPLTLPPPHVSVVIDRDDDALHTHTALAAPHPPSGRTTLHPGPGTTSEAGLAHDTLAALEKPPPLPGRFPGGRQPAWEAAAAWVTALPVTRLPSCAPTASPTRSAPAQAPSSALSWVKPSGSPLRTTPARTGAGWSPAPEPSRTSPAVVVAGRHG